MADHEKKGPANMRLDRFLAEMGQGSRSQVREMVKKGRVQVNSETIKSADWKIDPEGDMICLDGVRVGYARTEYYMLNKPQGVVSATEDKRYPTVTSLIQGALRKDLFPVGRLDIDTEGLLLITNDGALAHRLLSPKMHVDKTYAVTLEGTLPEDARERFLQGVLLEDGTKTLPAVLELVSDKRVKLTIQEGKFHQVKRMFETLGCHVVYLKRLSMGPLCLDDSLEPGQYRPLYEEEIKALKCI